MCVLSEGRNTTQLYMQLNATIDDVTATSNQWRHRLWRRLASRFPRNTTTRGCKGQNVRSSSVKNVYCWLFILGEKMFTVGKSRSILLLQILYNAVKRLIFFKCDELSQSTAFTFKTLLIFLEYIFEFLMNKAPPASDSAYQQNFTAKSFKYYNPPPFPQFCGYFVLFLPIGWFQFVCTATHVRLREYSSNNNQIIK